MEEEPAAIEKINAAGSVPCMVVPYARDSPPALQPKQAMVEAMQSIGLLWPIDAPRTPSPRPARALTHEEFMSW